MKVRKKVGSRYSFTPGTRESTRRVRLASTRYPLSVMKVPTEVRLQALKVPAEVGLQALKVPAEVGLQALKVPARIPPPRENTRENSPPLTTNHLYRLTPPKLSQLLTKLKRMF